jgi:D-glucosaminate-6-phosphate ammonia-lyase
MPRPAFVALPQQQTSDPGDPMNNRQPLRKDDIRARMGIRPIVNVSGTMTSLGASIIGDEAIAAMAEMAPQWVEMDDLQRRASATIARLTGAEAGFVTACCAAGITMSVAGAMTGTRLLAIERLPDDTTGLRDEVILQAGHSVSYGAPVDQSIRLAGGKVVLAGTATGVRDYHIAEAITDRTAAALFVVSHHTAQYGMVPLETFCAICHAGGVPVVVDAASEYDLRGFLARGADVAVYSGHKFLSGPTSGIVAGRKDLVRAAYLQNRGIGRAMKVGKETIAGTIAALDAWERRDHDGIRVRERAALDAWLAALEGIAGIAASIVPDPTGNPLDRLEVRVGEASGFSAAGLAAALAGGDPPIIVRAHEAELGFFYLDPCNLHPGEAEVVARALGSLLRGRGRPKGAMAPASSSASPVLSWPD